MWLQAITDLRVEMHRCGRQCTALLTRHGPKYRSTSVKAGPDSFESSVKVGRQRPAVARDLDINHKGGRDRPRDVYNRLPTAEENCLAPTRRVRPGLPWGKASPAAGRGGCRRGGAPRPGRCPERAGPAGGRAVAGGKGACPPPPSRRRRERRPRRSRQPPPASRHPGKLRAAAEQGWPWPRGAAGPAQAGRGRRAPAGAPAGAAQPATAAPGAAHGAPRTAGKPSPRRPRTRTAAALRRRCRLARSQGSPAPRRAGSGAARAGGAAAASSAYL